MSINLQHKSDTNDWREGLVVLPADHVYGKTALTAQEWAALEAKRAKQAERFGRALRVVADADITASARRVASLRTVADLDEPALIDRAGMLRIIAEAVAGGLPAPMSINLYIHPTSRHLELRMDNDRAEDVDAWVRAVSPDGEVSAVLGNQVHNTGRHPWRVYDYTRSTDEPLWHGWQFEVWASIDEPDGTQP
ncbi:MAG: hypothetical protein JWO67_2402 [Streptosporangiaceae bacterium]|nr:hypothetical protein [Streptosporangiaceae bacterium]